MEWAGRSGLPEPAVTRPRLPDQVVELAVLGAQEERRDLVRGVDQSRPVGVAGVADRDVAAVQAGHLDAVAARVAAAALAPLLRRQLPGRYAVVCLVHGSLQGKPVPPAVVRPV